MDEYSTTYGNPPCPEEERESSFWLPDRDCAVLPAQPCHEAAKLSRASERSVVPKQRGKVEASESQLEVPTGEKKVEEVSRVDTPRSVSYSQKSRSLTAGQATDEQGDDHKLKGVQEGEEPAIFTRDEYLNRMREYNPGVDHIQHDFLIFDHTELGNPLRELLHADDVWKFTPAKKGEEWEFHD